MQPAAIAPISRRTWGLVALLSLAFAAAYLMQINGWNQNAHYALVRAFADGTPIIDQTRHEIGDLGTGDISFFEGHYYSNKAPGLAFASMPAYLGLEAIGMRTTGDPTRIIWALHLFTVVPAFLILLVLVRRLAERVEPGFGTAAAVIFGVGTLVLPFSTLYFAHVLSAMLGFAAFAVLWREREGLPRRFPVALAGLLAGLAVVSEYSLVLVGVILGGYAIARGDIIRRGLAYAAGVVVGVVPLALYNLWAFGTIVHNSYEGNLPGELGGVLGSTTPSFRIVFDALFSMWGLFVLTPVVVCGAVGAVLMYRRGRRAEAAVVLSVVAAHLVWASTFRLGVDIFGGLGPPRYLMMIFPFLAVPFAAALHTLPLTTMALAVVSMFQMVAISTTNPLAAYDGDWLERLGRADVSQTAASLVLVTGWYTILLFFATVLFGLACAALATRRLRVAPLEAGLAIGSLLAWALIAVSASNPSGDDLPSGYVLAAVLLVSAAVLSVVRFSGSRPTQLFTQKDVAAHPSPR
jgi:hypothetical protein